MWGTAEARSAHEAAGVRLARVLKNWAEPRHSVGRLLTVLIFLLVRGLGLLFRAMSLKSGSTQAPHYGFLASVPFFNGLYGQLNVAK